MSQGARIHDTCSEPADTVTSTITALTGVNSAHRTIAATSASAGAAGRVLAP
ncbi:hypothetical protein [Streptomyces sp. NBC_01614]|uniref:hypothetical protein n=1 Tax=Streptomyces sp. NBC_01614 TaxID=2975897 RepID=UPI00386DE049